MTRRRLFVTAILVSILFPVQARAQKANSSKFAPGSPEDVFLKAIQALKKDRVEDFARAIDPEDLKRFQKLLLTLVELAEKKGEAQQLLRIFSGV